MNLSAVDEGFDALPMIACSRWAEFLANSSDGILN
jgi:hypothetical protein